MARKRTPLTIGTAGIALLALAASVSAMQPDHGRHPDRQAQAQAGPPARQPDGPAAPQQRDRPESPAAPRHAPQPPRQQEAERRGAQEQRWQRQRQDSGSRQPIRDDVREVSHKDIRGGTFQVPANARVKVVTAPGRFDPEAPPPRRDLQGCPPGIARRYPACAVPALSAPSPDRWHQPSWFGNYDRDGGYRYADGYLMRLGADSAVASYIPLLGGALAVGQAWPGPYGTVTLPDYYARYYDLGPSSDYRYYDDVIYRLSPNGDAITGVAALLSGDAIEIGRPMPAGYDIYNVPYRYRDQYYDGPKALYRYSDGIIYQIDPATHLVQAAIELLA